MFDAASAQRVLRFCSKLTQTKGQWAGQPLRLSPWQEFVVGSVFGWRRRNGARRFRAAYIEVPRGNGKSTLSAAVALWLAFFDGEAGAEVYCAATKQDQARIVWGEAARMVERTPGLRRRGITVRAANIHQLRSASKLEPLGADARTLDGLRPHGVILDELHAHRTRAVVDVMVTALVARRQPLLWEITTAGWDRASICWEHHSYSREVLEGLTADDTWFAFIAAADDGDDWRDPSTWRKANPNLGITVSEEDLAQRCEQAQRMLAAQNAFRRLHLDEWTEQADRAIDMAVWARGAAPLDVDSLRGRWCVGGLDLASTRDFTAFALAFPPEIEGGAVAVLPYFWLPEARLRDRLSATRMPLGAWVQQGLLRVTPGDVTDYDRLRQDILALGEQYEIREIAYDPWNATQLAVQLQEAGVTVIPTRQTLPALAAATRELLQLVEAGRLHHGGHPVLAWMAAQLAVETDNEGNLKPSRRRSTDRIDGIVALVLAIDRLIRQPASSGSVYDTRGIEFI